MALSALGWWVDAGVDVLVDEQPRDWLAPARPLPAAPAASPAAPARPDTLPDTLDGYLAFLATDAAVPFGDQGRPRLLPSGDPAAGLMLVADQPSPGDGSAGVLISGDEGRLLDRMLAAIGRDRASVHLAAMSCIRPEGGRLDAAASAECARLLRHHVALVRPRALLLFGDAVCGALLGSGFAAARGRVHDVAIGETRLRAVATLPPDVLLSSPRYKALAWEDLRRLRECLER